MIVLSDFQLEILKREGLSVTKSSHLRNSKRQEITGPLVLGVRFWSASLFFSQYMLFIIMKGLF
jgi:hypothetical protein